MSGETKSHGTLVAVELTPGGAFTTIGKLNGDITPPGMQRGETEVTPHNDDFDSWVSGSLRRTPLALGISPVSGNTTHDEATGLQKLLLDDVFTGYRFTKPDSQALIMSGFLTNFQEHAPVRDGAITADVTVRPSGPFKINSVLKS